MPLESNLERQPEFQARILAYRRSNCEICQHGLVEVIEAMLGGGQYDYSTLAGHYGFSRRQLQNHMLQHVPPEVSRVNKIRQTREFHQELYAVGARAKAEELHEVYLDTMKEAKDEKDRAGVAAVGKVANENLRTLAEIDGLLGGAEGGRAAGVQIAMVLPNTWKPPTATPIDAPAKDLILDGDVVEESEIENESHDQEREDPPPPPLQTPSEIPSGGTGDA